MMLMLKRFWIQLTTDKRRFSAICAGLIIGLLLWARVIVISRMPRHAIADPSMFSAPVPVEVGTTDKPRSAREIELQARPVRDPFAVNAEHFPDSSLVPDLNTEAGKSGVKPVEDNEHAGAMQRARLQSLVNRFKLDAVMTGLPMAVINGKTYHRGQEIPAIEHEQVKFTLVEVKSRSVILGIGDERFELAIAPPGAADR